MLAGLSETVGVAALYPGLASGLISVVAPVAAAAPVVPIVAALALGELATAIQGAGIALAVVGIVLTVRGRPATAGAGATLRASVVLGVVAVLSALYPLVTIALATLYLDESLDRIQLAGIACAFGGVVAVAVA